MSTALSKVKSKSKDSVYIYLTRDEQNNFIGDHHLIHGIGTARKYDTACSLHLGNMVLIVTDFQKLVDGFSSAFSEDPSSRPNAIFRNEPIIIGNRRRVSPHEVDDLFTDLMEGILFPNGEGFFQRVCPEHG